MERELQQLTQPYALIADWAGVINDAIGLCRWYFGASSKEFVPWERLCRCCQTAY